MRPNVAILAFLLGAVLLQCLPAHAQRPGWPRLEGQTGLVECREALALAGVALKSRELFLNEPQILPPGFTSVPVLQPIRWDHPGSGGVVVDPRTFDELAQDEVPRNVYWQRQPAAGYRIAVRESSLGWRGDGYTLHMIDPAMSFDGFMAALEAGKNDIDIAPAIDTGLRPLQLYERPADGALWGLDVDPEGTALSPWVVYLPDTSGLHKVCTVHFRPDVGHAVDLLPAPVRRLHALLDRAIGNANDRWSNIYIDQLREGVELTWANAALRPWVTHEPYNSMIQINHELERWARQAASNRRLLQDIRRQYPLAQHALTHYYGQQFGLLPKAARRQARFILERAFREHFVFSRSSHSDDATGPDTNPWRPGR